MKTTTGQLYERTCDKIGTVVFQKRILNTMLTSTKTPMSVIEILNAMGLSDNKYHTHLQRNLTRMVERGYVERTLGKCPRGRVNTYYYQVKECSNS